MNSITSYIFRWDGQILTYTPLRLKILYLLQRNMMQMIQHLQIPGNIQMKNKSHPERESYIEWYGSVIDPNEIDLDQINKDLVNLVQYFDEIENPED